MYIKKLLPVVNSPVVRSFVIGFIAGSFGLALNALLIDVFEASKIAFTYWLLMGVMIGVLHLYKIEMDLFKGFKKIIVSPYAVIVYIFIATMALYFPLSNYYFTGDDFTWFRWVSDCCNSAIDYFTKSNGFFYRPGTKLYFSLMYSAFWFNQTMYHLVSIFLHFSVIVLLFLIFKKIFRVYILSIVAVLIFLVLSGYHEAVFWISSTGFLFNAFFVLASLLSFIVWKEKKKIVYFITSLVCIMMSLLFHEIGVVSPLLIILYDFIFGEKLVINKLTRKASYLILLFPILPYLGLRFLAQSHWFSGDYSYNIFKLPYNISGNMVGYLLLDLLGPQFLPLHQGLRNISREHMILAILLVFVTIFGFVAVCRIIMKKITGRDREIVIFGFMFFLIALLPFLALGNITSRYSYLSSVGFVIFAVILLKKTYFYLTSISDKYIGTACIVIIVILYCMVQLFGLQKIHTDWKSAGEQSKTFLISIEEYAKDFWTRDKLQFYFVGMPIRNGEAWVWPVGLKDALWFTFKNPNIAVYTMLDINLAFDHAAGSLSPHLFRFDKNGSVEEVVRTRDGRIVPVNPPK